MAEDQSPNSALSDNQKKMIETDTHTLKIERVAHSRSNSSSSLDESFEIVAPEVPETHDEPPTNSDAADVDSPDPACTFSDVEDDTYNSLDEDDKFYKRLTKLRNSQRKSFAFPTNFRVVYVGSTPNETLKQKIFLKLSESLSNIFWQEAESNLSNHEIRPEKKFNLVPISYFREAEFDCYDDPGVAISVADFTNRPFEEVPQYLETRFQRQENDDDLVDLCVFFIPTDTKILTAEYIPIMKKLQGKVTLFPVIPSINDLNGKGMYFQNEIDAQRKSIYDCLVNNGVDVFLWKDDRLVQDRDAKGNQAPNWVESIFTKRVLAVEEFVKMHPGLVFEDMQLLRERSLEMRKERKHAEVVKKRVQSFERIVEILRTFTIMLSILYTIYLVVFGVWSYAEWSVIPSNLRDSLQVVSSATSRMQLEDLPLWQSVGTGAADPGQVEVYQLSRSRFLIENYSKRDETYEVVVKHNPQLLHRYDAVDIGNGQHSFEIDTTDAVGDVIIEVLDRSGELVKIIKWSPSIDQDPHETESLTASPGSEGEAIESKSLYEYTTVAIRNINRFMQPILRKIDELLRTMGDNVYVASVYISNQAYEWGSFVWNNFQARLTRWGKVAKYILQKSIDNIQVYLEQ